VVYSRPLKNGDVAVAFFNRGDKAADMSVTWEALGLAHKKIQARDLWKHAAVPVSGTSYSASVPTHGVVLLRVTAK
jgi:alpha-galactosidase